jgi:hypothetical protein
MSTDKGAAAPRQATGFDVRLSGASLWDLVQMECLAGVRRVFRVTGEGGVGYLYFSGGRLSHAVTSRLAGDLAALEILSWANGSFLPCERPWPQGAGVETSYEALILEIARRRDEQGSSNLLAFPGRSPLESAVDAALNEIEEIELEEMPHADDAGQAQGSAMPSMIEVPPPVPGARAEPGPDFPVMLRLAAGGAIVKNHGGSEELAEAIAYGHRLVQLAGELLGLDPFMAMECTFAGQARCFLFTEAGGDTVALRPRAEANLAPLRERLGL